MTNLDRAIDAARSWILDTFTRSQVPLLALQDEVTVCQIVRLNCEGGWLGFLLADPTAHTGAIYLQMCARYSDEFASAMFYDTPSMRM